MSIRTLLCGFTFGAFLFGAACGDDGPSDEDLIGKFVEDITGKVDEGYADRALSYIDLSAVPLDVKVPRHQGMYIEEDSAELTSQFRKQMLGRFGGQTIKMRSKKIEIDGDTATVKLTTMTGYGAVRSDITLKKTAAGWKVSRLRVTR